MNAQEAIRSSSNLSSMVLKTYLSDLDDADLMRRPGPGCNHLAWQLGHLIASESQLLGMIAPEQTVDLPDGFVEAHDKDKVDNDDASAFRDKQTYESLFDKVREATLTALDGFSEADLDKPAPEDFRQWCPTVGDMFILIVNHSLMHAGQFVVVRRQAGKPILM